MIFNYDEIFVDGKEESVTVFNNTDLNIFLNKEIIKQNANNTITPLFVGELITPNKKYFCLPKNFEKTEKNVKLTKDLILKYKDLRDDNNKLLLTNDTFSVQLEGDIESEKFFFTELKGFFLDFITYEFIYPKKRKEVHSYKPIRGAKMDVLNTIKNQMRYGIGVSYKTKDIENTKEWNLDDIYFNTLNYLCDKYGTDKDKSDIKEMKDYVISEGYLIGELDLNIGDIITDKTKCGKIINDINKCDVGIIHQPIKNTLLNYYKSRKIGKLYSIDIYYTKNFAWLWEYVIRIVLKDNKEFRREEGHVLPKERRFISKEKGYEEIIWRDLRPDIFSEYNGKRFIGDAKYYTNIDSDFYKEQYPYNTMIKRLYPVVVFIPTSQETKPLPKLFDDEGNDLHRILLSTKDVLSDLMENTNICINNSHTLIKKQTTRWK